jgi:hypothetical protein
MSETTPYAMSFVAEAEVTRPEPQPEEEPKE